MWHIQMMLPYVMNMFSWNVIAPSECHSRDHWYRMFTRQSGHEWRRHELNELMDEINQRLVALNTAPWLSISEQDEVATLGERQNELNAVLGGQLRRRSWRYYTYVRQLQGRAVYSFLMMAFVWVVLIFVGSCCLVMLAQVRVPSM